MKCASSPVFTFVDSDLKFSKPEVRVTIDRDKAQTLGVSALDIAQTLQASLSGQRFGYFHLRTASNTTSSASSRAISARVRGTLRASGRAQRRRCADLVRLDNLVTLTESSAPPELYRYNRYAAATISARSRRVAPWSEGIARARRSRGGHARRTLHDRADRRGARLRR